MILRIGINLGAVVPEEDDVLGDGVNVAARLEQICHPGGVLIRVQPTTSSMASSTSHLPILASSI